MPPAVVDYTAKSFLTGYRIGLKDPSLYVAIPAKYWTDQTIRVKCRGEVKTFSFDQIITRQQFNDKFIPGTTYTLAYVLWRKVKKGPVN